MKNTILLVLALCLSSAAFADVDPYNTFLWNRENALAGNGAIDRNPWYEWWYYKIIDPDNGRAFFLTYGVINPWDTAGTLGGTKAVVQVGDFKKLVRTGNNFPLASFQAAHDVTSVTIGENVATDKHVAGHVINDGHDVSWNFDLTKNWAFDAMGWTMKRAGTS
jgi:hypothetical protein